MIVVSVVLVVAAAALLIAGLVTKGLIVIYVSIAASVVAGGLLIAGVRTARPLPVGAEDDTTPEESPEREPVAAAEPARPAERATGRDEAATTVLPAVESETDAGQEDGDEPGAAEPAGGYSGPEVVVVSGRPRYHVADCRFVVGRDDAEDITAEEARELGFTACGVCRPDEVLGIGDAEPEPEPARTAGARKAPAKSASGRAAKAPTKAPAKAAGRAPAKAPAKSAGTRGTSAGATKAPAKAPSRAATKTTSAAARPTQREVVVIPDRDRFHRADCRFVRDAEDTVTLRQATAVRRGYQACGVCKPLD